MSVAGNYDHYHRNSSHSSGSSGGGPRAERCACCVRTMKWFPVLFIVAVIAWSYYAFVVQLTFFTVTGVLQRILFLLFYHLILVMFLWSYYRTVFTDIGRVPARFRVPRSELDRLLRAQSEDEQKQILEAFAKQLPIVTRTLNASVRFCEKCRLIKPDRAHHCSVCGVCVLKLDHHCPWVNNCINFTNYKFFILFLGYALVYCLYVAFSTVMYMELIWSASGREGKIDGRFHILFLFFVSLMFAISLVSLFGYHVYLVLLNRTTLESFRTPIFRYGGPDKNGFSLGKMNNFQEVFGDNRKLWFVPVYTSLGDGMVYPVHASHLAASTPPPGMTTLVMSPSHHHQQPLQLPPPISAAGRRNHNDDDGAENDGEEFTTTTTTSKLETVNEHKYNHHHHLYDNVQAPVVPPVRHNGTVPNGDVAGGRRRPEDVV
ncbi:zinc finger protein [Culex quinquefasciatus]|uniref:Palmitoyltransferase n=1 Tax=Culex quinquefasciatus TaxID=7176 RepID=B0WC84_CULQU|nr:zinc finger protein [Culex quinquefasciatus]|eukprot:XP_001846318.1 zinc finger protein [Culex quinquefasciatus]